MREVHVTVAAVVEREGRFLFVEEKIASNTVINQPAGHWEAGETLIEAMLRETLEETGWQVEPLNLLGVYEYHPPDLPYGFVRFAFRARAAPRRRAQARQGHRARGLAHANATCRRKRAPSQPDGAALRGRCAGRQGTAARSDCAPVKGVGVSRRTECQSRRLPAG